MEESPVVGLLRSLLSEIVVLYVTVTLGFDAPTHFIPSPFVECLNNTFHLLF